MIIDERRNIVYDHDTSSTSPKRTRISGRLSYGYPDYSHIGSHPSNMMANGEVFRAVELRLCFCQHRVRIVWRRSNFVVDILHGNASSRSDTFSCKHLK